MVSWQEQQMQTLYQQYTGYKIGNEIAPLSYWWNGGVVYGVKYEILEVISYQFNDMANDV